MRLNPYTQTAEWHRVMMTTKYDCWRHDCERHAVVVEGGLPCCVHHDPEYTGPVKAVGAW